MNELYLRVQYISLLILYHISVGCIGKCKKKADVGSSCTESEECVSNQCLCGSCTDLSKMNQNDYGCSQHTDCISGYCSITDENCVGVCQDGPPTSSPTISLAPTYSSTPKKKSEMSAVGLSVDGSWLHPDQPDSLGKYFSYDADLWNHYFGTVLVSTQGTQVAVKQCRDGAEIWTGEVSIWPNIPNFKGHELPPSGRRNVGANKGQWEKHDYVVKVQLKFLNPQHILHRSSANKCLVFFRLLRVASYPLSFLHLHLK